MMFVLFFFSPLLLSTSNCGRQTLASVGYMSVVLDLLPCSVIIESRCLHLAVAS